MDYFDTLPAEILVQVIQYLPCAYQVILRKLSTRWKILIDSYFQIPTDDELMISLLTAELYNIIEKCKLEKCKLSDQMKGILIYHGYYQNGIQDTIEYFHQIEKPSKFFYEIDPMYFVIISYVIFQDDVEKFNQIFFTKPGFINQERYRDSLSIQKPTFAIIKAVVWNNATKILSLLIDKQIVTDEHLAAVLRKETIAYLNVDMIRFLYEKFDDLMQDLFIENDHMIDLLKDVQDVQFEMVKYIYSQQNTEPFHEFLMKRCTYFVQDKPHIMNWIFQNYDLSHLFLEDDTDICIRLSNFLLCADDIQLIDEIIDKYPDVLEHFTDCNYQVMRHLYSKYKINHTNVCRRSNVIKYSKKCDLETLELLIELNPRCFNRNRIELLLVNCTVENYMKVISWLTKRGISLDPSEYPQMIPYLALIDKQKFNESLPLWDGMCSVACFGKSWPGLPLDNAILKTLDLTYYYDLEFTSQIDPITSQKIWMISRRSFLDIDFPN